MKKENLFYLLRSVKNIADKRLSNLEINLNTDTIISLLNEKNPDAIRSIAQAVEPRSTLIGRSIAIDMIAEWNSTLKYEFGLLNFMHKNNINSDDELKLARKISLLYREKILDVITTNPYLLVRFFSFKKVDLIGTKLMPLNHENRIIGLIDNIVKNELNKGNTAIYIDLLITKLLQYIQEKDIATAMKLAEENKRLFFDYKKNLAFFFGANSLEKFVIKTIDTYSKSQIYSKQYINQILDDFQQFQTFPLSQEQKEAVINSASVKFHAILGYAGTGKSTSLNALVYTLERLGRHIEMAALSGKAALRMSESCGKYAKTIFRFLKQLEESKEPTLIGEEIPEGHSKIFERTTIILDEASMIDLGNFANILRYLKEDTQLIILGDNFQLPPIAFGLVFHALVNDSKITSKLSQVFRQKDGNNIPSLGQEIRNHKTPILDTYKGINPGLSFLEVDFIDTARINKVVNDLGGFNVEKSNLQLIAATNKTVDFINSFMHDFNKGHKEELRGFLNNVFSIGDVVVYNKNNYKKNLYNGLIGYVTKVQNFNNGARKLTCRFENAEYEFEGVEISNVSLAYCLTCHKLQGSQSENIIIILENSNLLESTWFYTAITRAKKQAVVVGTKRQYEDIFKRKASFLNRVVGI